MHAPHGTTYPHLPETEPSYKEHIRRHLPPSGTNTSLQPSRQEKTSLHRAPVPLQHSPKVQILPSPWYASPQQVDPPVSPATKTNVIGPISMLPNATMVGPPLYVSRATSGLPGGLREPPGPHILTAPATVGPENFAPTQMGNPATNDNCALLAGTRSPTTPRQGLNARPTNPINSNWPQLGPLFVSLISPGSESNNPDKQPQQDDPSNDELSPAAPVPAWPHTALGATNNLEPGDPNNLNLLPALFTSPAGTTKEQQQEPRAGGGTPLCQKTGPGPITKVT